MIYFFSFSFKTCCNVLNTTARYLKVLHRIEAETFQPGRKFSRVWFGSDNVTRPSYSTREINLTRTWSQESLVHCQDHIVYLKASAFGEDVFFSFMKNGIFVDISKSQNIFLQENTRDIQSPIKLKLSYSLVQNDPRVPRPGQPLPSIDSLPILNQQEAAKILQATFQKDCGDDDICQSDLETEAFLDLLGGGFL